MKNCFFSLLLLVTWGLSSYTQATPVEYLFNPQQPIKIYNDTGTLISLNCEMRVFNSGNNALDIRGLQGESIVDGTTMNRGSKMIRTIYNLQVLKITTYPGALLSLTNVGSNLIRATCYD